MTLYESIYRDLRKRTLTTRRRLHKASIKINRDNC